MKVGEGVHFRNSFDSQLDSVCGSQLFLDFARGGFRCVGSLDVLVDPNLKQIYYWYWNQNNLSFPFRSFSSDFQLTSDFFRVSKELAYSIFFLILAESGHQDIRKSFCFLELSAVPCKAISTGHCACLSVHSNQKTAQHCTAAEQTPPYNFWFPNMFERIVRWLTITVGEEKN